MVSLQHHSKGFREQRHTKKSLVVVCWPIGEGGWAAQPTMVLIVSLPEFRFGV